MTQFTIKIFVKLNVGIKTPLVKQTHLSLKFLTLRIKYKYITAVLEDY